MRDRNGSNAGQRKFALAIDLREAQTGQLEVRPPTDRLRFGRQVARGRRLNVPVFLRFTRVCDASKQVSE